MYIAVLSNIMKNEWNYSLLFTYFETMTNVDSRGKLSSLEEVLSFSFVLLEESSDLIGGLI